MLCYNVMKTKVLALGLNNPHPIWGEGEWPGDQADMR